MKKILYFILLAAELFVGTCLMISLWDNSLHIPMAIAIIAVVALLTWQIILFFKTADNTVKSRIMLKIALIMLIPIAVFVITIIVIAIAFIIAFPY